MQNWIAVEYGSGMICASLILLKPLIKLVYPKILGGSVHGPGGRAAGAWHGQGKRAQCTEPARHKTDLGTTTPEPQESHDKTREKKALQIVTDRPRPVSYLEDLQSPDLESSYCDDPFSQASSQSVLRCTSDARPPCGQ